MKRVGGHRRHRQHRGGEEEGELESVPGMQDSVVDVGAAATAPTSRGRDGSSIGIFARANQRRFDSDSGSSNSL